MSILGGLVDEHHETELSPSTQFVKAGWFVRHFWTIMLIAVAAAAFGFWLGTALA